MSRKIKARKRSTAVRVLKIAGLAELVVFGAMSTVNVASADGMETPEWAAPTNETSNQTPNTSKKPAQQHAGGSETGETAQDSTQVKSEFDVLRAMIEKQQKQLAAQQKQIGELQNALSEVQVSQSETDAAVAQAQQAQHAAQAQADANQQHEQDPQTASSDEPQDQAQAQAQSRFHGANESQSVAAVEAPIQSAPDEPFEANQQSVEGSDPALEERGAGKAKKNAKAPGTANGNAANVAQAGQAADPAAQQQTAQAQTAQQTDPDPSNAARNAAREQVGERPPEEKKRPPELPAIADVGGILTPPGILTIEPSLSLSHTSTNRFLFRGVEILPSFLIGVIEVTEADREYAGFSMGARFGILDGFEGSVNVPFSARADDITQSGASLGANSDQRDVSGYGLGDVEAGLQYQINKGNDSWPIMVANVKVKIPTGQGPFDVERDATNGLEEELPTGSGFWGIQSSLTFMKTADPLVFYGNINYVFNMASDIDEEITTSNGTALILEVDPGDAIGVSFGGALAITENVSMSLGYEHYYVMATEQTASTFVLFAPPPPVGQPIGFFDTPVTTTGEDAQVGSLLFGVNFRDDEGGSYSMTLSAGLTDDAPDVAVSFRRPFSFDVGSWVQ